MASPLLSYDRVCAHYGAIQALSDVTLEIFEGEIVTLIGANGAGKTTLLMSLFQSPEISDGAIFYQGETIHHLPTHKIVDKGISLSPEGRRIFPKMTVIENLELGALKVKNPAVITRTLNWVFDLFPVLHQRQHQRAGTLSGGEQQMLAIGRSLMSQPKLFLLDEPSLGLAPQIVQQIFRVLTEIAQNGTTIFLVEQNAYHALKLANRGYVMVNGEIQLSGSSQELLNNPNIKAAYLGG